MARPFFLMSVINPNYYVEDYYDSRHSLRESGKGMTSDISKQLSADLEMMNAQWDVDNAWYNSHQSADARFNEYRDLGINSLSAARSVLGNPQSAEHLSASTISGTGADSALQTAINALGGLNESAGVVNDTMNTELARQQTRANVSNLDSQTMNNIAQNPWIAPQAKADIMQKEADSAESLANVGVLNERQKQIISETALTDENKKLVEKQVLRYDEYTTAQINEMQQHSNLYIEEAKTQNNIRKNLDADTILKGAETYNQYAQADLALSQSKYYDEATGQLKTINQFCAETGIPLDADVSARLQYYESKGDYDSMQLLLNTIFDAAAARDAGSAAGQTPYINYQTEFANSSSERHTHPTTFRQGFMKGAFFGGHRYYYNPSFNFKPSLTR